MRPKNATGDRQTRWGRKRRRLYARHRIEANAALIACMLLGLAAQDTITGWLMAGAPAGRVPIVGYLMVRPAQPDGRAGGTIRFEPAGPGTVRTRIVHSVLSMGQPPDTVETRTSHGGRWSIPASALRRGWKYRVTAHAGECPPTRTETITVPLLTRARVPPLTAASCGDATLTRRSGRRSP